MRWLPLLILLGAAPPAARGQEVPVAEAVVSTEAPAWRVPLSTVSVGGLAPILRRRAQRLTHLLVRTGRLDEAEAWVRKCLAMDNEPLTWKPRLAKVLTAQRKYPEAVELYQELVELRKDDPGLLVDLGRAAQGNKDLGMARRSFRRAYDLGPDPKLAYYLSELAFAQKDIGEGKRWARTGIKEYGTPMNFEESRLVLRLKTRFGWQDRFDEDYGELFDSSPESGSVLIDWARLLIRAGFPRAAAEPSALLREHFPTEELRWCKLESSRLNDAKEDDALTRHMDESIRKFPEEPSLVNTMAGVERRRKHWSCAEDYLLKIRHMPQYGISARKQLLDIRSKGHHHVGPLVRLRDSESTESFQTGLMYEGLPRAGVRVKAQASQGTYKKKSGGAGKGYVGLHGSVARERPRWLAGVDADLGSGAGVTAFSPGVFWEWDRDRYWRFTSSAYFGRLWAGSSSALAVGGKKSEVQASVRRRIRERLRVGLRGRYEILSVSNGGRASRATLYPNAAYTLLDRPVSVDASYRYVHRNTSTDDAFQSSLSLAPRNRTHYITLSAGRRWLEERLRTDAYIFNGHDAARGWTFGTGNLVGAGFNVKFFTGRWVWRLGYSITQEDVAGVGGRSQSVTLSVLWRWPPKDRCRYER